MSNTKIFARCPACKVRSVIDNGITLVGTAVQTSGGMTVCGDITCESYAGGIKVKGIKYTHADIVTCGTECKFAVSETCKCSCGGINHGSHA